MTARTVDLADARFMRDVRRLHALGPRAVAELLEELGRRRLCRTEVDDLVRRYAAIDPAMIDATGSRWLP